MFRKLSSKIKKGSEKGSEKGERRPSKDLASSSNGGATPYKVC